VQLFQAFAKTAWFCSLLRVQQLLLPRYSNSLRSTARWQRGSMQADD